MEFDLIVHWALSIIGAIIVVIVGEKRITNIKSIILAVLLYGFGVAYSMGLGSSFIETVSLIDVGGGTRYMVAANILLFAVIIRACMDLIRKN